MHVRSGMDLRRSSIAPDGGGADAQLQHAIEREVRSGQDRAVLALHLSQLQPPAPRAYHRRVAKSLLEEAAQTHSGQVVVRANADVVLLCQPSAAFRVRDTLTKLFRPDTAASARLLTLWTLPHDSNALETYLARSATSAALAEEPAHVANQAAAMEAVIATGRLTDIIRRQTAVQVVTGGMSPLFRELGFRMDALGPRPDEAGTAPADPFLVQHFAGRLDRRMMELLARELGRPGAPAPDPALHLNLSVRAILSPGFLRMTEAMAAASARLGVEVALADACADPLAFGAARMVVRAHGCSLAIDDVSYQSLLLTRPEALEPDTVKLDWTPRMANLNAADQRSLQDAMQRIGLSRLVLHHADTHAALAWGLAHGLHSFQGRHVDAMLAAGRMADCPQSAPCTVRLCLERAAATGAAGRAGCGNTARLDSTQIPQISPG